MELESRQTEAANATEILDEKEFVTTRRIIEKTIATVTDRATNAWEWKKEIALNHSFATLVLKKINSSYFSPRYVINELEQALIIIGYKTLKELVLLCAVQNQFYTKADRLYYSVFRYSVAVAILGKFIFRREFGENGEMFFITGLLHKVDFNKSINRAADQDDFHNSMLEGWLMPSQIMRAINCYSDPFSANKEPDKLEMTLFVANYVCQNEFEIFNECKNEQIYHKCLDRLKLQEYSLKLMTKDMKIELEKMDVGGILVNG